MCETVHEPTVEEGWWNIADESVYERLDGGFAIAAAV